MKHSLNIAILIVLAWSVSAIAKPSAAERRLAAFKDTFIETGETNHCINTNQIRSIKVIDTQHILFRMSHARYAVNILPARCHSLRQGKALVYEPVFMRLCKVDTVTILDDDFSHRNLVGPRCGLGQFSWLEKRTEQNTATPKTPSK